MTPIGFWSYVHADDDAEGGRIVDLAQDIVAQMEMMTAESIELFLDRENIAWGERWRRVVDEGLASVAFFIPILTPRYFNSSECRRELQSFARQATELGVKDLVMPILYVDLPALHDPAPRDDLVKLVKDFQWEPWTELRLCDRTSSEYRAGVARLASRLAEANAAADAGAGRSEQTVIGDVVTAGTGVDAPPRAGSAEQADPMEEPGTLDLIAASEITLPEWAATIEAIGTAIGQLGELFTHATTEAATADSRGAGMAGRLRVARELSAVLSEPVEQIYSLCNEFTTQLHTVDIGTRALIEGLVQEVQSDASQLADACSFFESIRGFHSNLDVGLAAAEQMAQSVAPMESMSRDLRRPLRRLRESLTLLGEARGVVEDWIRLIDESGLDCPDS